MKQFSSCIGGRINKRGVATLRCLPARDPKTGKALIMLLDAPYSKTFIQELKKSLPAKKRAWDNNDKVWIIPVDQFEKVTFILDKYFEDTLLLDFPAQDVAQDVWGKLYLLPGAPLEVVKAVYKALSLKYHPDRGGDVARMSEVNVAYNELMKEYKNGN